MVGTTNKEPVERRGRRREVEVLWPSLVGLRRREVGGGGRHLFLLYLLSTYISSFFLNVERLGISSLKSAPTTMSTNWAWCPRSWRPSIAPSAATTTRSFSTRRTPRCRTSTSVSAAPTRCSSPRHARSRHLAPRQARLVLTAAAILRRRACPR